MTENPTPTDDLKSRAVWWTQIGANAAVFAAAMAVLWLAWHRGTDAGDQPSPIYAVGETIDPVGQVDFRKSPATLVMVLRQNCDFCRQSLPFYQRLAAAAQTLAGRPLRLVVATTDEARIMTSYLKAHGISVDEVATVERGALKVPGTPALLLVDASGTVTKVWRGWLPQKTELEVFKQLGLHAAP